jgi:hypothetical protein
MNGGSCATTGQVGHTGQVMPETVAGAGHTVAIFADANAVAVGCGGGPDAQPDSANRIIALAAKRAACGLARAKIWTMLVLQQTGGWIASGIVGREILYRRVDQGA